ncbi:MAG TPA: hypothetical protein VMM76_05670 [Pirellulaceae bacterium]|nr:hypothetical protein [Pirellulaceae bacterium]
MRNRNDRLDGVLSQQPFAKFLLATGTIQQRGRDHDDATATGAQLRYCVLQKQRNRIFGRDRVLIHTSKIDLHPPGRIRQHYVESFGAWAIRRQTF